MVRSGGVRQGEVWLKYKEGFIFLLVFHKPIDALYELCRQ